LFKKKLYPNIDTKKAIIALDLLLREGAQEEGERANASLGSVSSVNL